MAFTEFPGATEGTNGFGYSVNAGHPAVLNLGADYTPRRFYLWSGAPPSPAAPGAGVAVHGVSGYANNTVPNPVRSRIGFMACPGQPFLVETGGAFSAGGSLKTDANGKAIAQGGSGVIVATALEGAGAAGEFRWAVFV